MSGETPWRCRPYDRWRVGGLRAPCRQTCLLRREFPRLTVHQHRVVGASFENESSHLSNRQPKSRFQTSRPACCRGGIASTVSRARASVCFLRSIGDAVGRRHIFDSPSWPRTAHFRKKNEAFFREYELWPRRQRLEYRIVESISARRHYDVAITSFKRRRRCRHGMPDVRDCQCSGLHAAE